MGLSELQPFNYEDDPIKDQNDEDRTLPIKPDEIAAPDPDPDITSTLTPSPDISRSPIKVPSIDYDGTDAETKIALKEQLINTINRSPIKKSPELSPTSTPSKTLNTKEQETKPNELTIKTTKTTTADLQETRSSESLGKSSKKSNKSSKGGNTAKNSKDKEKGCLKQKVYGDNQIDGVRKEDSLDDVQTSQASCSLM